MDIAGNTGENCIDIFDGSHSDKGSIILRGKNSHVKLGRIHNANKFIISVGSNCTVTIEDNVWVGDLKIQCEDESNVTISTWAGFNGGVNLNAFEGKSIYIGGGALFADGVTLSTGDSHSIFDLDTKLRVNYPGDIHIGTRVWIGAGSLVMKNVKIGSGSVIGARSVVTKSIPMHCLAAGVPAKIIRRRITWDQRLMDNMPPEAQEMFECPEITTCVPL